MIKKLILAAAVAGSTFLAAGAASAAGPNLITNGDFSAGNVGFTTGYTYVAPDQYNLADKSGPNNTVIKGEGKYTIASNPALQNNYFVGLNDNNQRLIVNGATSGMPIVFASSGALAFSGAYNFSADVIDICCNASFTTTNSADNPSTLTFQYALNGSSSYTNLASFTTNGTPGVTNTLSGSFMAAAGNTFTLRVINGTDQLSGNDFAIDNISVTAAAPEPTTWAFMIFGVAMAGLALRRRRSFDLSGLSA